MAQNRSWLYEWLDLILDDDQLTPLAKFIALVLGTYMNPNRNYAFPSQVTLARRTGHTAKTVSKGLKELVKKGWLSEEKRKSYGNYRSRFNYFAAFPPHVKPVKITGSADLKPVNSSVKPVVGGTSSRNSYRQIDKEQSIENRSEDNQYMDFQNDLIRKFPNDVTEVMRAVFISRTKMYRPAVLRAAARDPSLQSDQFDVSAFIAACSRNSRN